MKKAVTDTLEKATAEKVSDRSYYKLKLTKKDWIIMTVMVVIYSIIALVNLGSAATPTTFWKTTTKNEYFIVDLGEEKEISRINFFTGVETSGALNALYFDEATGRYTQTYLSGSSTDKKLFTSANLGIFKIVSMNIVTSGNKPVKTSKIKFVVSKAGLSLGEIAIFEKGSTTPLENIKIIENTVSEENGDPALLFDEQEKIDYSYNYMNSTYFDEVYHGSTGYMHYKGMMPYETTHPPLGKLIIALGFHIFGTSIFSMRVMGAIFGIFLLPLMYLFGKKITKETFGGFAAEFLMMFDFMHFTHSRISSIDVYVVFFVVLMFYFMYEYFVSKPQNLGLKKSMAYLLCSGVAMGCGLSVKWNAAYGAIGLALIFLITIIEQVNDCAYIREHGLERKNPWVEKFEANYIVKIGIFCVLAFIVLPVTIYVASYIPFMCATDFSTKSMFAGWGDVQGRAYTLSDIWALQQDMYKFHSTLTEVQSANSPWYSWPVIGKPLWMYASADNVNGLRGVIVTMGNPAVWWGGIAGVFFAIVYAIKNKDRRMVPVFIAIVSLLVPWILVSRGTYIYHYFPILPFVMLCTAYTLSYFWKKSKKWRIGVIAYFAVTAALFILFYPVLSGIKVPSDYLNSLTWLPTWYWG